MELNVVWIIGNGFDLNLGLKTDYRSFLEKAYFLDKSSEKHREQLTDVINKNLQENKDNHWSDLEILLGEATTGYQLEDETFYETFEEMQRLFIDYVNSEQLRLPNEIPSDAITELWDSICNFPTRLTYVDQKTLILKKSIESSISYNFINLNYTRSFDRFLKSASKEHSPFNSRSIGNYSYSDTVKEPVHIHGSIENGSGVEIIFGVASSSQIKNKLFAEDTSFKEMWIKEEKNYTIYGNSKTEIMRQLLTNADVFCIYGSSLGDTDNYIWETIGKRLVTAEHTNLVLFEHTLPNRNGQHARRYQKQRDFILNHFKSVSNIANDVFDTIRPRIILSPSKDIFKMELDLSTNEKYPLPTK